MIAFTIASMLCAIAQNLTEMVLFRAVQGVAGAFLVPLAQAVMFDINPPEKHGRAMALFGAGVMVGPILGPVLGGWLTDSFNWRWVFLVNLPVGVLAAVLMIRYHAGDARRPKRRFDLFGFALLALALAGAADDARPRRAARLVRELGDLDRVRARHRRRLDVRRPHARRRASRSSIRPCSADRNFAAGLLFMAVMG